MDVDELPTVDPNVDYTKILPIQQKRTIAFVNHFIMNTVSFLNKFAQSCESRLMEFEFKLQKVEASLLILESQLSSISGLDQTESNNNIPLTPTVVASTTENEEASVPIEPRHVEVTKSEVVVQGPKACEDSRFARFFKMIHFGVPPPAVKIKMQNEGFNPDILDTPEAVIPGFDIATNIETNENQGLDEDS